MSLSLSTLNPFIKYLILIVFLNIGAVLFYLIYGFGFLILILNLDFLLFVLFIYCQGLKRRGRLLTPIFRPSPLVVVRLLVFFSFFFGYGFLDSERPFSFIYIFFPPSPTHSESSYLSSRINVVIRQTPVVKCHSFNVVLQISTRTGCCQ